MTTATATFWTLGFFHLPGGWEWIVILLIALMLFGKRLPDVGKSLGKGIVEFKKGLKGMKQQLDEVEQEVDAAANADDDDDPKQIDAEVTEKADGTAVTEKEKADA